jgi:hypothetical protein
MKFDTFGWTVARACRARGSIRSRNGEILGDRLRYYSSYIIPHARFMTP